MWTRLDGRSTCPALTPVRAVTPVEWEGARIGILIHDPAAASGAALAESVSAAAALAAANARLQAEVRDQVGQVQASRRATG